jgi:uncharacterized protein
VPYSPGPAFATLVRMLRDDGLELLDEAECLRLLGSCPVGRVAFTMGGLPAVFPVNFALVEGDILFRTGEGSKLTAALHRAIVAFEVDAIDPTYHEGWSVLAVGRAEPVGDPVDEELLARTPVAPWAGGDRGHLVRIRPEFLSGRRIATAAAAATV